MSAGAQLEEGGTGDARPLLHFILAKDMSLDRGGATLFQLGLRLRIVSSFLFQIHLRPPLRITKLRP